MRSAIQVLFAVRLLAVPSPCEALPPLDAHYRDPSPPNPWGAWPEAPAALQARHDVIIVLGCPSRPDGSPSSCQRRRVDKAMAFAAAGYGDAFIVTGGAVRNDQIEAYAMRDLLVTAGVPFDRVFAEPRAQHTDENLYWSTWIMREQGWTSALVVSSPEHLLYAAVCDANCSVGLGRLVTFDYPLGDRTGKAASYVLSPEGRAVSPAECAFLARPSRAMCLAAGD